MAAARKNTARGHHTVMSGVSIPCATGKGQVGRTFEWPGRVGLAISEPEQSLGKKTVSCRPETSEHPRHTSTMNKLMIWPGYPSTSRMKGYATDGGGPMMTMICMSVSICPFASAYQRADAPRVSSG